MRLWIDAQLSPALAAWMKAWFQVEALPVRDLGLREAGDSEIYQAAREAGAIIMSKDRDFLVLQEEHGPPPQIIWVACGNTSNAHLKRVLVEVMPEMIEKLAAGEPLVEVRDLL